MKHREITFPFTKRHHDDVEWNGAVYWTKNWNPWTGCVPVSPACVNCYARTISERFNQKFEPRMTGKQNPPSQGIVFCGNSTDLFGDWIDDDELFNIYNKVWFKALKTEKDNQYIFLTKRVKRMNDFLCHKYGGSGIALSNMGNIYFGFTAENQEWYDKRLNQSEDMLGKFPMWLSCEPLLGKIDLRFTYLREIFNGTVPFRWVVVGAESGAEKRYCDIDWIYDIVEQCRSNDVPVFVKQIHRSGVLLKDLSAFPERLRIRQVPWVSEWTGK